MASAGDVTVFCDPALKPAIAGLSGLAGFGIYPLCAPGPAMLAQLIRHTRNDVLVTLETTMADAAAAGLIVPASRAGGFVNKLVLAGRHGGTAPAAAAAQGLTALLASARVALTDDTPASNLDGRAVLAAANLTAPDILGAANTGDVAFLVTTGKADLGLVYLTDAQADQHLAVIATLAAAPALTTYAAAVNAAAFSPNAQAMVDLMRSPAGIARLGDAGIKVNA